MFYWLYIDLKSVNRKLSIAVKITRVCPLFNLWEVGSSSLLVQLTDSTLLGRLRDQVWNLRGSKLCVTDANPLNPFGKHPPRERPDLTNKNATTKTRPFRKHPQSKRVGYSTLQTLDLCVTDANPFNALTNAALFWHSNSFFDTQTDQTVHYQRNISLASPPILQSAFITIILWIRQWCKILLDD